MTPVDNTTFHIRNQAQRALTLATNRTGKLGGWGWEARDLNILRRELEALARSTLLTCDLLDGKR